MCAYKMIVRCENGGYWAEMPALPGCYADGDTLEELKTNAHEAISFHLAGLNTFDIPDGTQVEQVLV